MKLLLGLILLTASVSSFADQLSDIQRQHREEKHEARKKWDQKLADCKQSYKNWYKSDHSDYDSYFKCSEEVEDLKTALQNKHNGELCSKLNIMCDRTPASLR